MQKSARRWRAAAHTPTCRLCHVLQVLGTPTLEEIQAMNQNYTEYKFPQAQPTHTRTRRLAPYRVHTHPFAPISLAAPLVSQVKPHPWHKVFRPRTPSDAIELVSRFLRYSPDSRVKPLEACAMPFFDELRDQGLQLPGNRSPPPLFDFKPQGPLR